MTELTNSVTRTVAVGAPVLYDEVLLQTGCGECHRKGTGSVKMRANGVYRVTFTANIAGATANVGVGLAMYLGGVRMPETDMIVVPAYDGNANNVAKVTLVKNCCGDYDRIDVRNIGTTEVVVTNPVLIIERVC